MTAWQNIVNADLTIILLCLFAFFGAIGCAAFYALGYRILRRRIVDVLNGMPNGVIIATRRAGFVTCNHFVIDALALGDGGRRQSYRYADHPMLDSICREAFADDADRDAGIIEIVDRHGRYRRWERRVSIHRLRGRAQPSILLIDRTDAEEAKLRLEHSRTRDPLTGLVNRDVFHDRFVQALEAAARTRARVAVLAIEIDQFDMLAARHGWEAAKRLLADVAARVAIATRAMDTAARVDQARFAVLLTTVPDATHAGRIAERFLTAIAGRYRVGDPGQESEIDLTASIGLAMGDVDGSTSLRLLDNATHACQRSRDAGGGRTVYYDRYLDDRIPVDTALVGQIRDGLETGQFFVEYQPIIALATRRITGFEALLRWRHPERGVIPPIAFITTAERSGLINPLGDFVLATACTDARAWPMAIDVSVNASVVQLLSGDWAVRVAEALAATGLAAHRLRIEITETASIPSLSRLKSATADLGALGVGIVLDDFGTGQSSLAQLRSLPFDGLKIDRQFVRDIDNPRTAEIVQMLISYCRHMGVSIVAEGVETEAQLARLERMECTHVQGYLFGRPLDAAGVLALLDPPPIGSRAEHSR
jgi:diguanylate cyclase (GGDEF)-like protein